MATKANGRDYWEPHVEGLRASGLTVVSYAREHGLSVHALGWWRRKLRAASSNGSVTATAPSKSSPFVALKVAEPMMAPSANVTIMIGSDVRLQLSGLPPPAWLATLSSAVRGVR